MADEGSGKLGGTDWSLCLELCVCVCVCVCVFVCVFTCVTCIVGLRLFSRRTGALANNYINRYKTYTLIFMHIEKRILRIYIY